jgi:hypothetical protein
MEPAPSSSPPGSLHDVIESSPDPLHHHSHPRSRPLHATVFPDPSSWCRSWARNNVVLPEPTTMCTPHRYRACNADDPCPPRVHSASSSPSPQRPEPAMPSNPRRPWACNTIILPKPARIHCIFFFVILGLQILILICYNATFLWYATLLLFCCIALICYIVYFSLSFWAYKSWFWYATLPHCFDMLHCFCSATLSHFFDMLHCFCSAALLWCATLSHYFDMLHCL